MAPASRVDDASRVTRVRIAEVTDAAVIATRRILMRAARALEGGEEPYAATHGDCYRDRAWSGVLPRNDDFLNDPAAQQMMLSEVP